MKLNRKNKKLEGIEIKVFSILVIFIFIASTMCPFVKAEDASAIPPPEEKKECDTSCANCADFQKLKDCINSKSPEDLKNVDEQTLQKLTPADLSKFNPTEINKIYNKLNNQQIISKEVASKLMSGPAVAEIITKKKLSLEEQKTFWGNVNVEGARGALREICGTGISITTSNMAEGFYIDYSSDAQGILVPPMGPTIPISLIQGRDSISLIKFIEGGKTIELIMSNPDGKTAEDKKEKTVSFSGEGFTVNTIDGKSNTPLKVCNKEKLCYILKDINPGTKIDFSSTGLATNGPVLVEESTSGVLFDARKNLVLERNPSGGFSASGDELFMSNSVSGWTSEGNLEAKFIKSGEASVIDELKLKSKNSYFKKEGDIYCTRVSSADDASKVIVKFSSLTEDEIKNKKDDEAFVSFGTINGKNIMYLIGNNVILENGISTIYGQSYENKVQSTDSKTTMKMYDFCEGMAIEGCMRIDIENEKDNVDEMAVIVKSNREMKIGKKEGDVKIYTRTGFVFNKAYDMSTLVFQITGKNGIYLGDINRNGGIETPDSSLLPSGFKPLGQITETAEPLSDIYKDANKYSAYIKELKEKNPLLFQQMYEQNKEFMNAVLTLDNNGIGYFNAVSENYELLKITNLKSNELVALLKEKGYGIDANGNYFKIQDKSIVSQEELDALLKDSTAYNKLKNEVDEKNKELKKSNTKVSEYKKDTLLKEYNSLPADMGASDPEKKSIYIKLKLAAAEYEDSAGAYGSSFSELDELIKSGLLDEKYISEVAILREQERYSKGMDLITKGATKKDVEEGISIWIGQIDTSNMNEADKKYYESLKGMVDKRELILSDFYGRTKDYSDAVGAVEAYRKRKVEEYTKQQIEMPEEEKKSLDQKLIIFYRLRINELIDKGDLKGARAATVAAIESLKKDSGFDTVKTAFDDFNVRKGKLDVAIEEKRINEQIKVEVDNIMKLALGVKEYTFNGKKYNSEAALKAAIEKQVSLDYTKHSKDKNYVPEEVEKGVFIIRAHGASSPNNGIGGRDCGDTAIAVASNCNEYGCKYSCYTKFKSNKAAIEGLKSSQVYTSLTNTKNAAKWAPGGEPNLAAAKTAIENLAQGKTASKQSEELKTGIRQLYSQITESEASSQKARDCYYDSMCTFAAYQKVMDKVHGGLYLAGSIENYKYEKISDSELETMSQMEKQFYSSISGYYDRCQKNTVQCNAETAQRIEEAYRPRTALAKDVKAHNDAGGFSSVDENGNAVFFDTYQQQVNYEIDRQCGEGIWNRAKCWEGFKTSTLSIGHRIFSPFATETITPSSIASTLTLGLIPNANANAIDDWVYQKKNENLKLIERSMAIDQKIYDKFKTGTGLGDADLFAGISEEEMRYVSPDILIAAGKANNPNKFLTSRIMTLSTDYRGIITPTDPRINLADQEFISSGLCSNEKDAVFGTSDCESAQRRLDTRQHDVIYQRDTWLKKIAGRPDEIADFAAMLIPFIGAEKAVAGLALKSKFIVEPLLTGTLFGLQSAADAESQRMRDPSAYEPGYVGLKGLEGFGMGVGLGFGGKILGSLGKYTNKAEGNAALTIAETVIKGSEGLDEKALIKALKETNGITARIPGQAGAEATEIQGGIIKNVFKTDSGDVMVSLDVKEGGAWVEKTINVRDITGVGGTKIGTVAADIKVTRAQLLKDTANNMKSGTPIKDAEKVANSLSGQTITKDGVTYTFDGFVEGSEGTLIKFKPSSGTGEIKLIKPDEISASQITDLPITTANIEKEPLFSAFSKQARENKRINIAKQNIETGKSTLADIDLIQGTKVDVNLVMGQVSGTFKGIAKNGEIIVALADGSEQQFSKSLISGWGEKVPVTVDISTTSLNELKISSATPGTTETKIIAKTSKPVKVEFTDASGTIKGTGTIEAVKPNGKIVINGVEYSPSQISARELTETSPLIMQYQNVEALAGGSGTKSIELVSKGGKNYYLFDTKVGGFLVPVESTTQKGTAAAFIAPNGGKFAFGPDGLTMKEAGAAGEKVLGSGTETIVTATSPPNYVKINSDYLSGVKKAESTPDEILGNAEKITDYIRTDSSLSGSTADFVYITDKETGELVGVKLFRLDSYVKESEIAKEFEALKAVNELGYGPEAKGIVKIEGLDSTGKPFTKYGIKQEIIEGGVKPGDAPAGWIDNSVKEQVETMMRDINKAGMEPKDFQYLLVKNKVTGKIEVKLIDVGEYAPKGTYSGFNLEQRIAEQKEILTSYVKTSNTYSGVSPFEIKNELNPVKANSVVQATGTGRIETTANGMDLISNVIKINPGKLNGEVIEVGGKRILAIKQVGKEGEAALYNIQLDKEFLFNGKRVKWDLKTNGLVSVEESSAVAKIPSPNLETGISAPTGSAKGTPFEKFEEMDKKLLQEKIDNKINKLAEECG